MISTKNMIIIYTVIKANIAMPQSGKHCVFQGICEATLGWQNIQFAGMNLAVASNFVVVTAASSNYVRHMMNIIGRAQRYLPNKTIIAYDIGMTNEQVNEVSLLSLPNTIELTGLNSYIMGIETDLYLLKYNLVQRKRHTGIAQYAILYRYPPNHLMRDETVPHI